MFTPASVRQRVINRLRHVRAIREEDIHDAYTREMYNELDAARGAALRVSAELTTRIKASHPERGWVMLSKEDLERLNQRFNDFVKAVT